MTDNRLDGLRKALCAGEDDHIVDLINLPAREMVDKMLEGAQYLMLVEDMGLGEEQGMPSRGMIKKWAAEHPNEVAGILALLIARTTHDATAAADPRRN